MLYFILLINIIIIANFIIFFIAVIIIIIIIAIHYSILFHLIVPCSLDINRISYDVPSRSSILVNWKPLRITCHNGILLGYNVLYQLTRSNCQGQQNTTIMKVATTKDYTVIEGLERTSNYCVWVRPYTRIGAANATKDLILPDQIGNMNDSLLILEH